MAAPIAVGLVYSAVVVVLSLIRPNAARIFLGIFFLVMGLGVNLTFVLTQSSFVYDYGVNSWLPLYRILIERIIGINPAVFGVLLIVFEVTMGLFLLSRGVWVKIGLVATMAFVLLLVPIHPAQIAWIGPVAANIYLLTKNFEADLIMMIRSRKHRRKNR